MGAGFEELRKSVCAANKELPKMGLVILTSGNVSAKDMKTGTIAIKPSGVPYDKLTPKDIALIGMDGGIVGGSRQPSTDAPTHLEIYRGFKEAAAVVHTHSPYATMFAQARMSIGCLGTTHADDFRGPIPVTRELTKEEIDGDYEANTGKCIVECFNRSGTDPQQVPAALVAGHGPFVWGESVQKAVRNAVVLEQIAMMAYGTMTLNPSSSQIGAQLLDRHFLRKHGRSAYYGQRR
jgi:L-ribulose-5-phosphate 4-epimerase